MPDALQRALLVSLEPPFAELHLTEEDGEANQQADGIREGQLIRLDIESEAEEQGKDGISLFSSLYYRWSVNDNFGTITIFGQHNQVRAIYALRIKCPY